MAPSTRAKPLIHKGSRSGVNARKTRCGAKGSWRYHWKHVNCPKCLATKQGAKPRRRVRVPPPASTIVRCTAEGCRIGEFRVLDSELEHTNFCGVCGNPLFKACECGMEILVELATYCVGCGKALELPGDGSRFRPAGRSSSST
jgi:hypothetical protein